MPFSSSSISVTTSPTLLVNPTTASASDPMPVVIINYDPTADLYIGGSSVTALTGTPIFPRTGISFKIISGEAIYGIAASGAIDTRVLRGRQ